MSSGSAFPFTKIVLSAVLCAALLLAAGCADEPSGPPEVWIIGLDGADWDQLGPMLERGEMPNLKRLRDGGASGVLLSDEPMLSPLLWTSIATGKTADQHGITWFMTDAPDGTKVPISSRERRVRAFWNIATDAGLSCGIVGWWATWPVEPVDGFMVSDYVGWHSFGITGRGAFDEGLTWPPRLVERIEDMMMRPADVPMSLMTSMVHLPERELAPDPHADPYSDKLLHLRQAIATSRTYTDLVLEQLAQDRPDVLAVYYEGTDAVSHLFGGYAPPRLDWVSQADYDAYRDVLAAYWRWQDELLGDLLDERGANTTVIVISDHGFRIGDERSKRLEFDIDLADDDHMADGLIVMNGPDIEPGVVITGADIYDVAPTILYAQGLPVGEDMAGHALIDAFRASAVAARPVATTPTYETTRWQHDSDIEIDPAVGENMEQMLRSLGYIAGDSDGESPDESAPALDAPETTVEYEVNLAIVLMNQGRERDAAAGLRAALGRHPDDVMIRLNLAQALARTGEGAEAEEIYRGIIVDAPDLMEAYEDLAQHLGRSRRPADALDVYESGLAVDPASLNLLTGKGHVLHLLGRTGEAAAVLDDVIDRDPRNHDAHLYKGLGLAFRDDLAGAAAALWRAHELQPANPETAIALAGVLQRQGDSRQALTVLERVRQNGGESPQLFAQEGALRLSLGDAASAIGLLERARELSPEDPEVLGNLGVAYAMTQRLPNAVEAFETLVAKHPDMAAAHAQLAAFYQMMQRPQDAERALLAALELEPRNAAHHLNLGMLCHEQGKLAEARSSYEQAIELDARLALAYYNLGMVEGAEGNMQEAERLIQRGRELDPSLPPPARH